MMDIQLPDGLETSIRSLVQGGRFASIDDAMAAAARLLLQQTSSPPAPKPTTESELHQHMISLGLMTQLPDRAADFDDPDDQPVIILGEPLSETIIRERR